MTKITLFALATLLVIGAGASYASPASTQSQQNLYSQVDGSTMPENALFTRAVGYIR